MHRHQIKRNRPTLETAHAFHKEGSFEISSPRHQLSDEEREAEIRKISNGLSEIVRQQFPRTQNLEYAILKSHLIIEYALVQYIRSFVAIAIQSADIRFSFSQKLEFAYLLGFGANDPLLLPTIERLNKVRNQVAHTFFLDRRLVDELLQINHEDHRAFKPKNDRERIRGLRYICAAVCGRVAGEIEVKYWLLVNPGVELR
ncbi:hypothetical protein [Bradyrhizobium ganzhouense]|uniref:hypothetical protein n=1 Tax=Bradyrhizobium ganzhouense TaxID=1179767 RepID=UPI003CF48A8F